MKKIVRLTESDLTRIVKRVIMEQNAQPISLEGKWYKWVHSDSLSHGGKAVDVEMEHVPSKGQPSEGKKTWTVACNGSITPKIKYGQTDKLSQIAAQSARC